MKGGGQYQFRAISSLVSLTMLLLAHAMLIVSGHAHSVQVVTFFEPEKRSYEWKPNGDSDRPWIELRAVGLLTTFDSGRQLIVHTDGKQSIDQILQKISDPLCVHERTIAPGIQIFVTPSAPHALQLAAQLGGTPGIHAAYPNRRRQLHRRTRYAPQPNDRYYSQQWYLENRDPASGIRLGPDLNLRRAWSRTRGEGVTIAVVDDGIDLNHPDLSGPGNGQPHRNFLTGSSTGIPQSVFHSHGTAVAGLAAAEGGNEIGMSGVAPAANLASWVIFDTDDTSADSIALSEMFLFANDKVFVQNHSWGNGLPEQFGLTLIEETAVSNAVYHARGGKGIVMVRAAGNNRERDAIHPGSGDTNDDAYSSHPGAINVASIDQSGRAAVYSNAGASILVAAPGGVSGENLFTTDRTGRQGFTAFADTDDLLNYSVGRSSFFGTSAAAPQVAGLCALLLATNPNLAVRDIQQILLLSSIHYDIDDPGLRTNGAGLKFSHNVGFGVPDAARAIHLAERWLTRPELQRQRYRYSESISIPDDGLFVTVEGENVPTELAAIPAFPSEDAFVGQPREPHPLRNVGRALSEIEQDLTGSAALVQRGENLFEEKVDFAAAAGAEFAIIYNNVAGDRRVRPGGTYYSAIPAVFISQNSGDLLAATLADEPDLNVSIGYRTAEHIFQVDDSLQCEQVGLHIKTNHDRRGDLEIILTSPQGTVTKLQRVNSDTSQGPVDWTYYSTHFFFEASQGPWKATVIDMALGNIGDILELELVLHGIPQVDQDKDGLNDNWEQAHFGNLSGTPTEDPDRDGQSNLLESILGQSPLRSDLTLRLDLSAWNESIARLAWPSTEDRTYEIWGSDQVNGTAALLDTVTGQPFETEYFRPFAADQHRFFRVVEISP